MLCSDFCQVRSAVHFERTGVAQAIAGHVVWEKFRPCNTAESYSFAVLNISACWNWTAGAPNASRGDGDPPQTQVCNVNVYARKGAEGTRQLTEVALIMLVSQLRRACTRSCCRTNLEPLRLAPDGKAITGAISTRLHITQVWTPHSCLNSMAQANLSDSLRV